MKEFNYVVEPVYARFYNKNGESIMECSVKDCVINMKKDSECYPPFVTFDFNKEITLSCNCNNIMMTIPKKQEKEYKEVYYDSNVQYNAMSF